ncbi:MAG: tRNA lysidine(34) synthetase TilS [Pseudomonadota bacterium]
MTFSADWLQARLSELIQSLPPPNRYLVAFSGGLDSTVLLHALSQADIPQSILALHVDHGLQSESKLWAKHCKSFADSLGIACDVLQVTPHDPKDYGGIEAAARAARYGVFKGFMTTSDVTLTAHHRDDQAETQLFNLVRGAGLIGAAGMRDSRPHGDGHIVRPLLTVDRSSLHAYALKHNLQWIEDPTNCDTAFDRNFLRHEVVPLLQSRWPDVSRGLARSATHLQEANAMLDEIAAGDLQAENRSLDRLSVSTLKRLSRPRQKNGLRFAIRQLQMPLPTAVQLEHIIDDVVHAGEDRMPVMQWSGAEIRRYRDTLYLMRARPDEHLPGGQRVHGNIHLGDNLGRLHFDPPSGEGLNPALVEQGLELRFRKGGEEILLKGQQHTKTLKNLLQEAGVVPWMRDRIPLLFADDQLVAVADLWLAAHACSSPGMVVRWQHHPPIY